MQLMGLEKEGQLGLRGTSKLSAKYHQPAHHTGMSRFPVTVPGVVPVSMEMGATPPQAPIPFTRRRGGSSQRGRGSSRQ